MAASSRTLRAWLRCALIGVALIGVGCEQPDDVVATVSALGDGGPLAGAGADARDAEVPHCEPSQLYVLLSSIVRNQCRVPSSSAATIAVLGAYFLQNPPTTQSGETRPPSSCDLVGGRFRWAYELTEGAGDYYLCPAHCELAQQYVAAEDQRVLECQGFGSG